MNYALMISNRVEEKLLLVERDDAWNDQREKQSYRECLATVLREEEGRAWADGNVRIGDYILLSKRAGSIDMWAWLMTDLFGSRFGYSRSKRLFTRCDQRDGTVSRGWHSPVLVWRDAGRQ